MSSPSGATIDGEGPQGAVFSAGRLPASHFFSDPNLIYLNIFFGYTEKREHINLINGSKNQSI
jgi:hypothetical protein